MSSVESQMVASGATLLLALSGVAILFWRLKRRGAAESSVASLGIGAVATVRHDSAGSALDDFAPAAPAGGGKESDVPLPARQRLALEERLEPATRLVGARGLIVWIIDPAGRRLSVKAAFGYEAAFLDRIDSMELDERVLTALAFVERRSRSRKQHGSVPAAVAVPMVHDGAAVGVLTAEMDTVTGPAVSADALALLQLLALQMAPALASELPASALTAAPAHGSVLAPVPRHPSQDAPPQPPVPIASRRLTPLA